MNTDLRELKLKTEFDVTPRLIVERCWLDDQSWYYELMLRYVDPRYTRTSERGTGRLRVSIRRNAFDMQSHAKVQKWDGKQWQDVCARHISECKCKDVSYVQKKMAPEAFHVDATTLLNDAFLIVL